MGMKPKICMVTPSFPPWQWGGLARTCQRVTAAALDMGLEVHVACPRPAVQAGVGLIEPGPPVSPRDGLWVHQLKLPPVQNDPHGRQPWDSRLDQTLRTLGLCLEQLGRAQGLSLFHSFFIFPMGYVTGLAAARLGLPHLTTVVGDDLNRFAYSPEKLAPLQLTLAKCREVVFLSQELHDLAGFIQDLDGKGRVILNSVEIPPLARATPRPDRPWRLGCAGKMKFSKGLSCLLSAWSLMPPGRPAELEIRGTIRAEEMASLPDPTRPLPTGPVRYLPPLPPSDMPHWLGGLEALVLPSLSEGCPNILMEAMACGLPCVATRVGAVAQLMEDGLSGLLVPWGDPPALASALARLRDDPALALALGAAARERMAEFSPERERAQWQDLYCQLLA
jgi:glycosyltransferase involved in cell wall biosynthesis